MFLLKSRTGQHWFTLTYTNDVNSKVKLGSGVGHSVDFEFMPIFCKVCWVAMQN
jgi:hypothetical protein